MDFLMMIGSQRAGSTLLHSIIKDLPEYNLHPIKELHYFDTKFKVRSQDILEKIAERRLGREVKKLSIDHQFIENKEARLAFVTNVLLSTRDVEEFSYLTLFGHLNFEQRIGECSPEYMLLPLKAIRELKRSIPRKIKVILIARNPTKRLLSAIKLFRNKKDNLETVDEFIEDTFSKGKNQKWLEKQDAFNDYKSAIEKYKKVFPELLVLSYDDFMLDKEGVKNSLENILEINISMDSINSSLSVRKNEQGKYSKISEKSLKLVQSRYVDNYNYLLDYFGKACEL